MSIMTAMPQGAAVEGINPNLLDNWYFIGGGSQQGGGQLPINSRRSVSVTQTNGFFIDRWRNYGQYYFTAELQAGGLRLTGQESAISILQQIITSKISSINGRVVTFSILTDEDGLISKTTTVNIPSSNDNIIILTGNNDRPIATLTGYTDSLEACIRVPANEYVTIKAIKLELGSVQTLAHQEGNNWVINEIPNYSEQLERCMVNQDDPQDQYANKHISTDVSNSNLLRNWYFVGGGSQQGQGQLPINPTGQTSYVYSSTGATIRQWATRYSGNTVTLYSDGITLASGSGNENVDFYQALSTEECVTLLNEQITISLLWENGILDTFTSTWTSGTSFHDFTNYTVIYGGSTRAFSNFTIRYTGTSPKLKAVKLEIGNQQTLCRNIGTVANPVWELDEIPDYDLEWARCMDTLGLFPFGLSEDLVIHVDAVNGNDSNDGFAAGSGRALKTINAAFGKIPYNANGRVVSIVLAESGNTTYPAFSLALRNGKTIIITKESSAATANVKVAGGTCTDCGHSSIIFSSVTFTGATVTFNGHNRLSGVIFSSCTFDNAPLSVNGPYARIQSCTFKNLSDTGATAISVGHGMAVINALTIENTVLGTGVKAVTAGIVSVATYQLTNNAATGYACSYSGRIFVGGKTYHEATARSTLNSNSGAALSGNTPLTVNLNDSLHNKIVDISVYPGSDTTAQGIITLLGETMINSTHLNLPIAIGTTVGTIKIGKVTGSDTSFVIESISVGSYNNLKLNAVIGYPLA